MSHSTTRSTFPHFLQSASLVIALTACASTEAPHPGSLKAIKQSQFMPVYQQCLRENAPHRPVRTSATMLNEVAIACMKAAKRVMR